MRFRRVALAVLLAAAATQVFPSNARLAKAEQSADKRAKKRLSDAQVKKLLIDESIAAYDGNCPCPYSRARNGSRCGKRSAYNREGGASPLCFPEDVSAEMVKTYRDEHPDD